MSSIKATIKSKTNKDEKHSIIIVLIKDRKNTSISTGLFCKKEEWSFETERLKTSAKKSKEINRFIDKVIRRAEDFIEEKKFLEEDYNLKELIEVIKNDSDNKTGNFDYFIFHNEIINELKESKKNSTARINQETLNSLKKFTNSNSLKFNELNYEFLQRYDGFLRKRGGTDSGIGIKMRTIRAIYNMAIKRGLVLEKLYPFKFYKISNLKKENKREYLTEQEIEKLKQFDLTTNKRLKQAKDLYLFSFYCRGMNFIDLIQLDKTNFYENRISYNRNKTGVNLNFKLIPQAIEILDEYSIQSLNKFLFPILLNENMTLQQIENRIHKKLGQINSSLKEIMIELEINKKITFYTARHSFATFLKFKNISVDAVSEMLGHTDIKTTQAYLNKLPNKHLDNIIDDVFAL